MNAYARAGVVFALITGVIGAFMAYQLWEVNEIRNSAIYKNRAICAPNNIFLSDDIKMKLCKAEQTQQQIEELKDILKGAIT